MIRTSSLDGVLDSVQIRGVSGSTIWSVAKPMVLPGQRCGFCANASDVSLVGTSIREWGCSTQNNPAGERSSRVSSNMFK